MTDSPTFREWLKGREPSIPLLREYLSTLRDEWLQREDKAATNDINAGLCKAIVALHNTKGGEVFLGVNNDGQVSGTTVTVERVRQVLSQRDKPAPNDACIVDLNSAVALPLKVEDGGKRVIILEVLRTGKAALFLDDDERYQLLYRRGNETLQADGAKTIDWYRQNRREEMLIGLYKELRAFTRRIRIWSPFPEIPDPVLPYLARCMADGSLYTFLSEDDLISVIGGSKDNHTSDGGFVGPYLSAVRQARELFRKNGYEAEEPILGKVLQEKGQSRTNLTIGFEGDIDRKVNEFGDWLRRQGILLD